MKRDIKVKQMQDAIIKAATTEFAEKGYEAGSLNVVASEGDLSKGIIYHYFHSKKELYLSCIRCCFASLTDTLKQKLLSFKNLSPEDYFRARSEFFMDHPQQAELFCQAVLYPPEELVPDMQEARKDFDSFNESVLRKILEGKEIRQDLGWSDILTVFQQLQDFLNARYHQTAKKSTSEAMRRHEQECLQAISVFLYGIVIR